MSAPDGVGEMVVKEGAGKVGVMEPVGLQAVRISRSRPIKNPQGAGRLVPCNLAPVGPEGIPTLPQKRKLENLCMALSLPLLFQDRSKIKAASQ
jgi:hypothetical protein